MHILGRQTNQVQDCWKLKTYFDVNASYSTVVSINMLAQNCD